MIKYSVEQIYKFLLAVDNTFATPLSKKQDIKELAVKFFDRATVCAVEENGEILAMVAGYTEALTDNMAYISVVATLPECKGKGYASGCILDFIEVCKSKNISAIHLYTDIENRIARAMYKKLGFVEYICDGETRPEDVHLIYRA